MARTNRKPSDSQVDKTTRVAGGTGALAARQDDAALLRRAVLANLLWEDVSYQDGKSVAGEIKRLVPLVDPETVALIAHEARVDQKLRHVPLLLARECARHRSHRRVVEGLLPQIIRRPDELTEFLSLYWLDDKNQPIASSVKKGLAASFTRFNAYSLAKYNRDTEIKLRDVMFLVHPEPRDEQQAIVFKQLANDELPTPDTWEVALSAGHDKRKTWTRLILDGKLGALAFMRNLRNMQQAGVHDDIIREGFANLSVEWLLPLNFFAAVKAAPDFVSEIEQAMFRSLEQTPKLSGTTDLVVDVSGSMTSGISSRSEFSRLDAAASMAVIARECCEHVRVWVTAGSDTARLHKTKSVRADRGFALADKVVQSVHTMGGGGIFTRQALEYIKQELGTSKTSDRTIVFSDSQDCDINNRIPAPFSTTNYVVDVSSHTRGINYRGVWTAEISGWSEKFVQFIHALEDTQ